MKLICAWCTSAFLNSASLIYYHAPCETPEMIHERGSRGVEKLMALLAEKPGGWMTINQQEIASWDVVSFVDGTAVCSTHVIDALERHVRMPSYARQGRF